MRTRTLVTRAIVGVAALAVPLLAGTAAGADDPNPACEVVGPTPVGGAAGCTEQSPPTTQAPEPAPAPAPTPSPETPRPTPAPESMPATSASLDLPASLTLPDPAPASITDPPPEVAPASVGAAPAALVPTATVPATTSRVAETILAMLGLGATAALLIVAVRRVRSLPLHV